MCATIAASLICLELVTCFRLHRSDNHEVDERVSNLSRGEHGDLSVGVICRGDLDDVGPNNRKAFKTLENGQELTTRPAAWLGSARSCSSVSKGFPL